MRALGNLGRRGGAAVRHAASRIHLYGLANLSGMDLEATIRSLSAASLTTCRRVLSAIPSSPTGVGRQLPPRVGRRRPIVSGAQVVELAHRAIATLRDAAVGFVGSARSTLGEARPEDGLAHLKRALGGGGPRRRRLGLGAGLVAIVVVGAMGLAGAMAAPPVTVIEVDNTADKIDTSPGDGLCIGQSLESAVDQCTLRAALMEANALAGVQTVSIVPGTYSLAIVPLNENAANVGDLEILDPVTIETASGYQPDQKVIIDGGNPPPSYPLIARGIDRLFEIHPGAGDVTFRDVILQNGYSPEEGGAIQNWSWGKLTLEGVTVRDNYAEKAGGGVNQADVHDYPWTTEPPNLDLLPYGRVEIKASTFTGNGAGGGGAAINNVSGGTIAISDNSVVTLNPGAIKPDPLDPEEFVLVDPSDYEIGPSAIAQEAQWDGVGTLKITDSTVSLNAAEGNGAGISSAGDSFVALERATLTENRTAASGAGLYTDGGFVTVLDSDIARNQAANGGGLYSGGNPTVHGLRGRFEVKDSRIAENIAENGGGILSDGEGQLFVTDTVLTKNHSSDHGAAIASEGRANMTLTRAQILDNESWGEGGGVWTHSERQQTILDSLFEGNDAGVPHIEDGMLTDDVAGGGALLTDGGPVTVLNTTIEENTATEEGGGLSIHNLGHFVMRDSTIQNNRAQDGGGLENSAHRVTFERVLVFRNRAAAFGGGIYNTSSDEFHLTDSTIRENSAVTGGGVANAPDNAIIVRGSLFLNNSARSAPLAEGELDVDENAGKGGGLMSFADGDSLIENTTFSGNKAASGGGALFHDADGELRLTHVTIWRNSAPVGGGIGVMESDFVPEIPPKTNAAVVLKNSIVGGSIKGGSCDWYVRSEGGNLETGNKNTCFLAVTEATAQSPIELGVRDRRGDPQLWAIADNGGPTMTHALQYGSLAIDSSAKPCSIVDQRGEDRPQNGRCDAGAYEYVGDPPAPDDDPPETYFEYSPTNPKQDGIETMAFTFSGSDVHGVETQTPANELNFECRLIELELTEPPEIIPPWEPVPPELRWNGCSSPWSVPLAEEGMFTFEVRAIDRMDNIDPTPISQLMPAVGMIPPETEIIEKPPLQTNSRAALFSFRAISDFTPSQFAEFECRLDSRDPAMWLECTNPAMYSDLTTGLHTFEVRALAGEAAGPDPTPAKHIWRVGPDPNVTNPTPLNCDQANITLTPRADGWTDQVNPVENYALMTELTVRSAATDPGNGGPIVPENARSFFRFDVPTDALHCELESALLRIWAEGGTEGRTIEVVPAALPWKESTLTWFQQPAAIETGPSASTESNGGGNYLEWNAYDLVEAIRDGAVNNGWVVKDANESDTLEGGDQGFLSRETPQDPPDITMPELILRYAPEGTSVPPDPPSDATFVDRSDIECGETIFVNTRLTADLTGCLTEGIAIGAPGIILDLNGHTISSGLILEPGEEDGLIPGVRSGFSNVEVRGPGVITNFGHGVLLGPGATHNLVGDRDTSDSIDRGLTLSRNILSGVQLFDADDGRNGSTVRGNTFDANGETGVQLFAGTEGALVDANYFTQNGTSIHVDRSSGNTISNNEISGIILDPALDSDAGIVLENSARDNALIDNDVSDTGDAGVKIHMGSHGNTIDGGIHVRNGDAGIIVEDSNDVHVTNVVSHQQSDGGVVFGNSSGSSVTHSDLRFNPSGVDASNTNGFIVDDNDVSYSLQAGIELGNGLNMRITNNTANLAGGSGIALEGGTFTSEGVAMFGALIDNNTANQNGENGISAAVAKHTISNNKAYNNAGFGILAGEEVVAGEPLDPNANIDGGGNEASGNMEIVNCLGVFCDEEGSVPLVEPDPTPPETEITDGPLGVPYPDPDTASVGSETAVFRFTAYDALTPITAMTFECRLDAPPDVIEPVEPELEPPDPLDPPEPPEPPESEWWAECVSPFTIQGLEPGGHVLEVRATDHDFNVDLTPAKYEWTIHAGVDDQGEFESPPIAPQTQITAAPGELAELRDEDGQPVLDPLGNPVVYLSTTNHSATLRFRGSDNLTAGYNMRYECRTYHQRFDMALTAADIGAALDGQVANNGWESCTSPKPYTDLDFGGHIFQVRAIDRAGNWDPTPATHTWWIHPPPPDTIDPETTILSGPDKTTVATQVTFDFTGTDNQTPVADLEYECRLVAPASAATAWESCTSPHTTTLSSPSTLTEHVFQVRAIDLVGNRVDDSVAAAYVWNMGPAPVPKTVFCAYNVTQSIKLNNSLGDCIGHGLIVKANNVTIDLNGKTIDGKSIGAAILNNGFDNVTIKNGVLTDFDYGVMLNFGATSNVVQGVTAHLNQEAGVALGQPTAYEDPALAPSDPPPGVQSQVTDNIVRSNTLVSNTRGVWILNGASDNLVRGNLVGATSGEAVLIDRSHANRIEGNDIEVASKGGAILEGAVDNVILDNTITDVGAGVIVRATTSGTTGIESTGNRVEGNLVTDSSGPAFEIEVSSGNEIVDNVGTLVDSAGVELYQADDNLIKGNVVSGNKSGVSVKQSTGNVIEGNDASESDSTGIALESQSFGSIVRNNLSSNNGGNGIYLGDETPAGQGTLVEGNTTNHNVGMGIQATKPSHMFRNNAAFDNGSWGINVSDPSNGKANIDGGGNVAQGNDGPLGIDLKPQQCYNITCLAGPGFSDQIAPDTSILEGPDKTQPFPDDLAVFRFTGSDNASPVTFECNFGGGGWETCTSPASYPGLTNGEYTFEIRSRDFSGNVDPTPAAWNFDVELGEFEVSIDSGPDPVTVQTSATFEFSASNGTAPITFQCRLVEVPGDADLDTAPECTSPMTFTALDPATTYEFWVRATDASSNANEDVYTWTVGPAPVPTEVFCGQVVSQSIRVTNDLIDCGGYALIVGAPNITIDLDGHTIDGMGLDAGIYNGSGHDNVTITNGYVLQFLYGVQLNSGTKGNIVSNLRLEQNEEAGIALADADEDGQGNTIRDNSVIGNELGIALFTGTQHALIRGNTLAANGGEGSIYLEFASQNRIEGNQVAASAASGVFMVGGGGNLVLENSFKDTGGPAIMAGNDLLGSSNNTIQRNTVKGGQGGVLMSGSGNEIVNNTIGGSLGPAIAVELGNNNDVIGNELSGSAAGIILSEANNNLVAQNNASGTTGSGIEIGELSLNNEIVDNTTSGNGGSGIEVTETSIIGQGNLIARNTADANGGDGLYVEGATHEITENVAQLNGGWGIYTVGGTDGGGNFAAGNMEPDQCFGVVCTLGVVPGAPDTSIVAGPPDIDLGIDGIQSNSRNASFTYLGFDEPNPITDLVFECRIDSTNALAWEDCEYPAEYLNLSPGSHVFEVRALDMLGQGLADPTPARFEWTYVPMEAGVGPDVTIDIVPEDMDLSTPDTVETWLPEAIFTFHANEPDVAFQCRVDTFGWQPCGFEGATYMSQGAFEWALAENEVGDHTFQVRAVDFEGNWSEQPAEFTWTLLGVVVTFTDGPGFTPATGGPQGTPATGGPTASTSASIEFEANVDGAEFWCRFDSLDPGEYFPCESPFLAGPEHVGFTDYPEPLLPGDHMLEVFAEHPDFGSAAELEPSVYEWEVVDPVDNQAPNTFIESTSVNAVPIADPSATTFEVSGVDDLTPPFLLAFQCQVTAGTEPPSEAEWIECFNPVSLLDLYTYEDPQMSVGEQHTFWVRAVDMAEIEFPTPPQTGFEGNPDPTPAFVTWTPTEDVTPPTAVISSGPADGATIGEEAEPYTFLGSDNATPILQLTYQCAFVQAPLTVADIAWEEVSECTSPFDATGQEPGTYTFAVRAVDMAGNGGIPASREITVAAPPVVTILSGPAGKIDPDTGQIAEPFSSTESAVFTFRADQPGSTFECSLDGGELVPCNELADPGAAPGDALFGVHGHAFWVVQSGEHSAEVRATNAQGIVGEEVSYEWFVQLGPDTTRPTTRITAGPENGTTSQIAIFRFTGSDNRTPTIDLSFQCALDSATVFNSCESPQQFEDLTRGLHTLRVRAVDAAGLADTTENACTVPPNGDPFVPGGSNCDTYTWFVTAPPTATILTGPGVEVEESTATTATFTFTSDVDAEPDTVYHCWLDGAFNPSAGDLLAPAPCTSPVTYTDLGLGPHLFAVRAVDPFENLGVWEDVEFVVTPPVAEITSAPGSSTSTDVAFEFISVPDDPDATFYCSLDGRPFGLCESPKAYTNLWPGEHTFQVQTFYTGVDWMGQPVEFDPVPATHTWTVQDFTPPETYIDFGPNGSTISTSAYIGVSSDDPTALIECTLNGAPEDCEPGVVTELTDLLPGAYTFTAQATDPSGNVDTSPATRMWTIETPTGDPNTTVGESVSVSLLQPGGAGSATVTYFSVETAGFTVLDQIGGGPSLPEGYNGASSMIYDISTTALFSEPVVVCLTYDPAEFATTAVRLLHFDGELWLDITTLNNPFDPPATVCGEAESFSLFAVAAANSGMLPETSILSGPGTGLGPEGIPTSTTGSATFRFWADQPGAITQCSIDGDPFFFCESPLTIGPLEVGDHEFTVQAINDLGFVDLTPAIYEWEIIGIDTTPPSTVITKGPTEDSETPNYISTFEFSGSDDFTPALELDFECTLDGLNIGGCETPEQIEVLTAGEHTLLVQAIDAAGNIDPVGATRTWTVIDMSGPDTEIILGPEEETTDTFATFEFEGFELLDSAPVTQFECALDEGPFTGCTSPHTIDGPLDGGLHVFHVRAVDPDGNRDISPAYYEWLIVTPPDTTPPDTEIVFGPDPPNSGPDVMFGFASSEAAEFECVTGDGPLPAEAPATGWESCEAVFLLEMLPSGQHWLFVRAVDFAEPTPNVDPSPDSYVWTTTGEPDTEILTGPQSPTSSSTAKFTFESDQTGATFQCSIDGFPFVNCSSPFETGGFLPDVNGDAIEHTFEVRAVNQYTNIDGEQVMDLSPAIYEWTVQDTVPPDTEFLGATEIGPPQFVEPGLRFQFRGDDDMASSFELTFECLFDNVDVAGETWEECGEPGADDTFVHDIAYADLEAGRYEFQVRALDVVENADASPAPVPPYEFVVEAEPDTTITGVTDPIQGPIDPNAVELLTDQTSITFDFSTDTGATFLCRLSTVSVDLPAWESCNSGTITYAPVAYGTHLFEVMAVGAFGTADPEPAVFEWQSGYLTAPDLTIETSPTDVDLVTEGVQADSSTATFTFSSTDTAAFFQCSLDGAPLAGCPASVTYENLRAGEQNVHTLTVVASKQHLLVDVAPPTEALFEWTIIDDEAPNTVFTQTPNAAVATGTEVTFGFTGTDNGTVPSQLMFECRVVSVDPALPAPEFEGCSSPVTHTELTGGTLRFEVRATDLVPLTDQDPAQFEWQVVAPPATLITGPVEEGGVSESADATFTFFDQPGSTYECRRDPVDLSVLNAGWTQCDSGTITYTGLTNGEHLFQVRATTLLGVVELPVDFGWTVDVPDAIAPDTSIDTLYTEPTTSTTASLLFSGTDNLTAALDLTFQCRLDSSDPLAWADCASGDPIVGLAPTSHTLEVRAVDGDGNVDPDPASHTWTVFAAANNTELGADTVDLGNGASASFENVTSEGLTSLSIMSGSPALLAGYSGTGAIFDVSTTAAFMGNVEICLPYSGLDEPHLLHYVGEWVDVTSSLDEVNGIVCGLVSSLSPFAIAEAPGLSPDTTIPLVPDNPSLEDVLGFATADFGFASNLLLAEFECSLDGLEFGGCEQQYSFQAAIGQHTLDVRAVNLDTGLFDLTPASYTWTVLARPVATVDSGPVDEDPTTPADIENESTSATFEFSTDQPGDGSYFECRLIGDGPAPPWGTCTSPKMYEDLALGEHTFEVQAINAAGHVSLLPAQFDWEVADLTPPDTTITSGPSDPTSSTSARFEFAADEPASYVCTLDELTVSSCASGFEYTGLDPGTHTFTVLATDLSQNENVELEAATHTWTIDTQAPEVTLGSTTILDSADFTFSATDNLSTSFAYECRLDGAAFATCTNPQSFTVLDPGSHTFQVRTADAAGNTTTASHTWTSPDLTDPETELSVHQGSVIFHFSGSDNFSPEAALTYQCSLSGSEFTACVSPVVYENDQVGVGTHTFRVRAVDEAGNVDETPEAHTWTVLDTTAPDTTITDQPLSPTPDTGASFTFTGSDNASAAGDLVYECALDGGAYVPCTSPKAYSALAPGSHTFRVKATDEAGNTDASAATYTWTILDTTAPETSITAQPQASTGSTSATFEFAGSDDVTAAGSLTLQCSLDSAGFAPCASPASYSGLSVGSHTFQVKATDAAGNTDSSAASYTWTVLDTTAPQTSITSSPLASTGATSATFEFGATDDVSSGTALTFECSLDSSAFLDCASPKTYSGLFPGSHTFEVRATDAAGNQDQSAAGYTWTVLDTIDPDTTITEQPLASTGIPNAVFEFTGSDDVAAAGSLTFQCALDGGAFTACTSPKSYSSLSIASHTFQVRALDAAGNVDDSPASYTWSVVDVTAPETTITARPPSSTIETGATFEFTGTDNHSAVGALTYQCSLDSAAFAACSSPAQYAGLAVGPHTFQVKATDGAGNTDSNAASWNWTVTDSTPPDTSITAFPENPTPSSSATFEFTGTDAVTPTVSLTYRCSLDGAPLATCSSPKGYSGILPGSHTFSVQAVDAAGNADAASPATYTWTVTDVADPDTSITGHPAANTTNTTATFTFSGTDDGTASASLRFECSLDGAAFAACSSEVVYTDLAVDSHTFEVKAIDAAGNTDDTPASYSWAVQALTDTTDPETSITAEPPATTTETTASFGFAGTDDFPGTLSFECALDSTTAWSSCTSQKSYSVLSVGSHTFRVRAIDAAGNVDETPAAYSWTIQAPVDCGNEQTLTASADAWIDQGSPTNNNGSASILKVMSKGPSSNLRALVRFNLPAIPQGCSVEYATLRIYAKAGAAGRTLQVQQLAGSWMEGGVTWGNQPATTGGLVTTGSGTDYRTWNVASLVHEMYTGSNNGFLVRDANENQDAEQQLHSREESTNRPLLVLKLWNGAPPPPSGSGDSTPPDTTITGSPLAHSPSTAAGFTFNGVDNVTQGSGLTFECQLDVPVSDPWTACSTPSNYTGLAQGSHIFRVRAKDAAGNVDAQPALYTWTVDTTAPETVISLNPPATTTSTTASFEFNSSETGSSFQCSLDGGSFAACTSPKDYTGLAVTSHTFQVRATDAAGNQDGSVASYTWTIQPGGAPVNCGAAQTVSAAADSWLEQSSPTSNKGTDGILKVMSKSGNANMRALVRFNLPAVPAGCVLETATLRLYAASASGSQRTLQALRANASWNESSVTWANQPATIGSAVTTTSGTGYRSCAVTTIVGSMYSSGSNNGFLIRDAAEGSDAEQQFHAREKGDNPPQLVVTFKAP